MLVCLFDDLVWFCYFVIFFMIMWVFWKKFIEYEFWRFFWIVMYSCSVVEGIKICNIEFEEDFEFK